MTNCPPCLLNDAERKVIAEMRLLARIGKRGGIVKVRWIADRQIWDVTTIKK